jgi:hypothetical protein
MTICKSLLKLILLSLSLIYLVACGGGGNNEDLQQKNCGNRTEILEQSFSLTAEEKLVWHKDNLYDLQTDSYYLPPELLYANVWGGDKGLSNSSINYFFGYLSCDQLVGPISWTHPNTLEVLTVYAYKHDGITEYLHATNVGFELVFDGKNTFSDKIFFPTGYGWHLAEPQVSNFTQWSDGVASQHQQAVEMTELVFDAEGVLFGASFRLSIDGEPVYEVLLEPKRGITRVYDFYSGDDNIQSGNDCGDKQLMADLDYSLSSEEKTAWERNNLYDVATDSYFIPIELWSGGIWQGNKDLAMNSVNMYFGTDFCKHIFGPFDWQHPFTSETLSVYQRNGRTLEGAFKVQYFTIANSGLGRTYDSRDDRYLIDEVKFPVGFGWRIDEPVVIPFTQWRDGQARNSTRTVIITRIVFDENDVLVAMTYRWYTGEVLDHEYTFMPRRGMAYTVKYSED